MVKLLFASMLLSWPGDAEHIEPLPDKGTSAAVVVADSVPLVHTQQITGDAIPPVVKRLDAILKNADSSLDRIIKLNFIATNDAQHEAIKKELAASEFGRGRPAVSFVTGKLPTGATWAVDAVAMGTRRPAWKQVTHGDGFALLPPGTRIYISGQAVPGKDLAEATRLTLAELRDTLKFLGLKESAVVQAKAFVQPMAEYKIVQDETAKFFQAAGATVPPLVLVEWQSSLPVEIELIVWGGRERPGEPIEYLTPPALKASPVYSRVARVNDGKLIYLSSLVGKSEANPEAEIPEMFDQMGKTLAKAGSDFKHLAKATYYVTGGDATRKMREIRPRYYDPKRPPAASLAEVASTGHAGRSVTMDMIAIPSPRLRVNEYGPAERGHGLTDVQLRDGFISLFDGQSAVGWSDGQLDKGLLTTGRSNFAVPRGQLRLEMARAGKLRWGKSVAGMAPGTVDLAAQSDQPHAIELSEGLQLRSILYKPSEMLDITPRMIGADWKPIHHPKLPAERRATWTLKDGVLTAVGGPGCLEYQGKLFGDFILQLEARTKLHHANSGIFFRAMPGAFMNGYEAQIYNRCHDGDVSKPWTWATGAIDDRQNARRLVSRDGEWFHYTIVAVSDDLATFINGYQTVDWQDTRKEHENPRVGKRTSAGAIQLQAHDLGTEVEFRHIRIASWK